MLLSVNNWETQSIDQLLKKKKIKKNIRKQNVVITCSSHKDRNGTNFATLRHNNIAPCKKKNNKKELN